MSVRVRVRFMVSCSVMTKVRISVMDWVRVMVSVWDSVRHSSYPQQKECFILYVHEVELKMARVAYSSPPMITKEK